MTLDRWIASIFLVICLVYGYSAWFVMDVGLPPFMQRNPVWPSTFPKILAVLGIVCAVWVLLTSKEGEPVKEGDIDYRNLRQYKLGQAGMLIGLMVAYAFALYPIGFIVSTIVFLTGGAAVLGERKLHIALVVATVAAFSIWYLVQVVLGIFLRPWPWFM